MTTQTVELSNVIYNATSQSFEALATVYNGMEARKIACAIAAPIDMTFEDAAKGLTTQALRRHSGRPGLASVRIQGPVISQRAGRPDLATSPQPRFDAFAMLRRLVA